MANLRCTVSIRDLTLSSDTLDGLTGPRSLLRRCEAVCVHAPVVAPRFCVVRQSDKGLQRGVSTWRPSSLRPGDRILLVVQRSAQTICQGVKARQSASLRDAGYGEGSLSWFKAAAAVFSLQPAQSNLRRSGRNALSSL